MSMLDQQTDTIDNDREEAEASRKSQRAAIRRKIATIEVTLERIRDLREIVERLDDDDERATDEHQSKTGPLQAELEQLDEKHINAVVAGKSLSASDTARRREILQSIADENVKLEDTIQANKRARRPLEKQIREQEKLTPEHTALNNRLVSLASDQLQMKLFVAKQSLKFQDARLRSAQKSIEQNLSWMHQSIETNDHGHPTTYQSRINKWEAEVDAATEAVADAHQQIDELLQEMRDEV